MKKSLYLFISILIVACSNGAGKNKIVERDTTITPQNAFTNLFLDSTQVARYIEENGKDDSVANKMKNFYNSRNYQFAWFNEKGLTEQAEAFWNTQKQYFTEFNDSSIYNKWLFEQMGEITNLDSNFHPERSTLAKTEMGLTRHFFKYVQNVYESSVSPEDMQWHIPRRKINAKEWLDSLIIRSASINEWKPMNRNFNLLEKAVFNYKNIIEKGGWQEISTIKNKLKKGQQDSAIYQVKLRLQASGDYPLSDTSFLFNEELGITLENIRVNFGLPAGNYIDAELIKVLNVPAKERLEQLLINLERMRWMPALPDDYLITNIPDYTFTAVENGKPVMQMRVVVGKAANQTVIFSDMLQYVVFSPYWNIPRSIVRNEIVPAMNKSSSYISRKNMEITGYSNGLPVVRQKPGGSNSLGRVKFIFPNRFNIYFHDTPAKSLFERDNRSFSHGCIRLQRPYDLAVYLLRNNETWDENSIKQAMNANEEKWVSLKTPVPVFITYLTAWVNEEGAVQFRDDIYGHDSKMAEHLFAD